MITTVSHELKFPRDQSITWHHAAAGPRLSSHLVCSKLGDPSGRYCRAGNASGYPEGLVIRCRVGLERR